MFRSTAALYFQAIVEYYFHNGNPTSSTNLLAHGRHVVFAGTKERTSSCGRENERVIGVLLRLERQFRFVFVRLARLKFVGPALYPSYCTIGFSLTLFLCFIKQQQYVNKSASAIRMALKEPAQRKAMAQENFFYNQSKWTGGVQGEKVGKGAM